MMENAANVPTPELDKQKIIIDTGETETLTRFVDWLESEGYHIARRGMEVHDYQRLFAEFYDLDLDKIEAERMALIHAIRFIPPTERPYDLVEDAR